MDADVPVYTGTTATRERRRCRLEGLQDKSAKMGRDSTHQSSGTDGDDEGNEQSAHKVPGAPPVHEVMPAPVRRRFQSCRR